MSNIVEITAESWTSLVELLYADSWERRLGRFRSPYAFRGLGDANWSLATSLIRLGGTIAELERHLLRNFLKYAHRHVLVRDSFWFWLTFGQHHGLPTRLLDWTYSPFVALHFATSNVSHFDRNAAIWMADFVKINSMAPEPLASALKQQGSNVFSTEMLTQFETAEAVVKFPVVEVRSDGKTTISSLAEFDKLSKDAMNPFMIFFEPPSIDERVVNQFALFSVVSNPVTKVDQFLELLPGVSKKTSFRGS